MESCERPASRRSRAWMAVVALAPVPLVVASVLDADSTALLVSTVVSATIGVLAVLAWAIQRTRRQRRDFEERLADWASERAVAQERLRIARELHDLSSHGLGLITVRAAATGYLDGPDADAERRRAMHDIERIGRATTTELRRMLTVLRSAPEEAVPLRPADTLAALPGILDAAARNGLLITPTIEQLGEEADASVGLGPGVQLAICAIVREGLANVLRHAGPTTVRLRVVRVGASVTIAVDDDGPHPGWRAEPGAGHGLTGLRERVRAHGGTLTTTPTPQGFRLEAVLPAGAST